MRRAAAGVLLAAVCLVLGAAPLPYEAAQVSEARAARVEWELVEETFHALTLGGHPCGRSCERIERAGDRFRTSSTIEMRFVRLGQETRIELASEFVEDARGEPIEATVRQRGAETVRFVFESPRRVRVERGEVREVREIAGDAWLTPREVTAFIAARHATGAAEIRFSTLDVQSGFVVAEIVMKRIGEVEQRFADRALTLVQYEVRNSIQPVVARDLYDAEARLCESVTAIGLGDLVSRRSTRAEAIPPRNQSARPRAWSTRPSSRPDTSSFCETPRSRATIVVSSATMPPSRPNFIGRIASAPSLAAARSSRFSSLAWGRMTLPTSTRMACPTCVSPTAMATRCPMRMSWRTAQRTATRTA